MIGEIGPLSLLIDEDDIKASMWYYRINGSSHILMLIELQKNHGIPRSDIVFMRSTEDEIIRRDECVIY